MSYVSHKLGRGVKDSVLKYHNDTTIRLGDICEKQRLAAAKRIVVEGPVQNIRKKQK